MCRVPVAAYPSLPTSAQSPDPKVSGDAIPEDQAAAPAAANPSDAGVILATRYKTKMCLSIEQGEECVYQNRCMFAHSEEELRTKEQNLADGITTETAIREHRRRVHMQIKQRNKRKEKRREKQIKKQQLLEMEAQGITLPEYQSSIPEEHQQALQEEFIASPPRHQLQQEEQPVYRHDPYAFPQYTSFPSRKCSIDSCEGHSAAGETDSYNNDSGASSPRRHSRNSSSSCVVAFESSDFYHYSASCSSSMNSSFRGGAWSHNPYPRVIFHH